MSDMIQPAEQLDVGVYHFDDDGSIPNHPLLPLLVYPGVLRLSPQDASPDARRDAASVCEEIFVRAGWGNTWRNGIFSFHHFHSTAHETLAIARGQARVHMGGEQGKILEITAGDVLIIPAGVGHKNLGADADLLVVGAYPPGPQWDLCRGEPGERPQVLHNIQKVPLPATDPVYGEAGPLHVYWR